MQWTFRYPSNYYQVFAEAGIDDIRDRVYIPYYNPTSKTSYLAMLDRASGTLLYQKSFGTVANNRNAGTPSIGPDGTVFVGNNSKLYALDPSNNLAQKWVIDTITYPTGSAPTIGRDGNLYIRYAGAGGGLEDQVAAVDADTGSFLWTINDLNLPTGAYVGNVYAAANDMLVFTVNEQTADRYVVYAYGDRGASGYEKFWEKSFGSRAWSLALGPGNTLYVYGQRIAALASGTVGDPRGAGMGYEDNTAPEKADSPSVPVGGVIQSSTVDLAWEASDPDGHDLSYTVLLGAADADTGLMVPVASGLTASSIAISGLGPGTTYYWKVVATDGQSETAGPTWMFSTASAPSLDADDNCAAGALTDGILSLRYLFDPSGDWPVDDALGPGANRTDREEIRGFLDGGQGTMLDVDDNGANDALTDGILILRYLFGFQGNSLVEGALAPDANRTDPVEIAAFLDTYLPTCEQALVVQSESDKGSPESLGSDSGSGIVLAAAESDQQIVTPDPASQTVEPGDPVTFNVDYTTNPEDPGLTGLGLRMHYDSSVLTFVGLSNVLSTGLIQQQPPAADTEDHDSDPNTDKYVLVSWADIAGNWPGQIPQQLFSSTFNTLESATEPTAVNFTSSSAAAGWQFQATSAVVSFAKRQIVSGPAAPIEATTGDSFSFPVSYDVSDNDNTLTGIGLRMHYDSSVMTFDSLSSVLATNLIQQQPPVDDTADYDGDSNTDKYVLIAWADPNGQWPNEALPADLFTSNFTLAEGLLDGISSTIRFTASSTAGVYDFSADPVVVQIAGVGLDVDDNGSAEDATDGILVLRYLFGFRGDSLVENALAPDAERTDPAEIVEFLDRGKTTMLDPDDNGQNDALTDGILIRRYLLGWTGQDLIEDALSPDANQTDPSMIVALLTDFMPPQGLLADDEPAMALALAASRQIVTPDPVTQTVYAGEPVILHVNYSTDPEDASLTGLGLRMHYNSQLLTFGGLTDRLGTGFVQEQTPADDTEDFDNDPLTDKYVLISWADLEGSWPGQLDIRLFTSDYTAGQAASGSTSVSFTASSTAAGWSLDATSAVINFLVPPSGTISGWAYVDANRNGEPDAGECLPGVTIFIDELGDKATKTDDNGWYQFTDVSAGTHQVREVQPKACLPGGGPDSITVVVEGGKDHRVDFWDAGLRPDCIWNRLLATSTLPPGSTPWNQVMREIVAEAEKTSTESDPADALGTGQPAAIQQLEPDAQSMIALSDVVIPRSEHATAATVAPSSPQIDITPAPVAQEAVITQEEIGPIVEEAIARWAAAGLDQPTLNRLRNADIIVSNLPDSYLGIAHHSTVYVDQDAAGNGWFVDLTPSQDEEYVVVEDELQAIDPRAVDRMDLLSVVAHELGHIAGLQDSDIDIPGLMNPRLGKGLRRVSGLLELDAVFATGDLLM